MNATIHGATTPFSPRSKSLGSDRRLIGTGVAIIVAAFGIFGTWAANAPLSGAIIVVGTVVVESARKTVQHLEGGIVKAILVKQGSIVKQGQPIVMLEQVQADAAVTTIQAHLDSEMARVARLSAERVIAAQLEFPRELLRRASQSGVAQILDTERKLFATRRNVMDEQITLLRAENVHIREEAVSLEHQVAISEAGIGFAREQLELNEKLQSEKFVSNVRLLELRGQLTDKQHKRAEAVALTAQARQKIKQNELKIEGLRQTYIKDAADDLRQTERRVDELRERMRPNQDALTRSTIVAPIAGEVVDLKVHTVGGVIAPREVLMEIVPAQAPLVIKAKARTEDITHLRVGADVAVQLTAYKRRTTPVVNGKLTYVSADLLTEQSAAGPIQYFEIRISVAREALNEAGELDIVPGMPIEAYLQTEARTVLEYLIQPITQSMRRAGREF